VNEKPNERKIIHILIAFFFVMGFMWFRVEEDVS